MVCWRMELAPWLSFLASMLSVAYGKDVGMFVREKGGFAAVGVAEEEDRDCWWVVHIQLPTDNFTA